MKILCSFISGSLLGYFINKAGVPFLSFEFFWPLVVLGISNGIMMTPR